MFASSDNCVGYRFVIICSCELTAPEGRDCGAVRQARLLRVPSRAGDRGDLKYRYAPGGLAGQVQAAAEELVAGEPAVCGADAEQLVAARLAGQQERRAAPPGGVGGVRDDRNARELAESTIERSHDGRRHDVGLKQRDSHLEG